MNPLGVLLQLQSLTRIALEELLLMEKHIIVLSVMQME